MHAYAQSMSDMSVCFWNGSDKLAREAFGGKELNTCDPNLIQSMIIQKGATVTIWRFKSENEIQRLFIQRKDAPGNSPKIRSITTKYTLKNGLLANTNSEGCVFTDKIVSESATQLQTSAISATGNCDDADKMSVQFLKQAGPTKYSKIKIQ